MAFLILGPGFLGDFLVLRFVLDFQSSCLVRYLLLACFIPDFLEAYLTPDFLRVRSFLDFILAYFIHYFIRNCFRPRDFFMNPFILQDSLTRVYSRRTRSHLDFKDYFQLRGYLLIHLPLDYHQDLLFQATILRASLELFQPIPYPIHH